MLSAPNASVKWKRVQERYSGRRSSSTSGESSLRFNILGVYYGAKAACSRCRWCVSTRAGTDRTRRFAPSPPPRPRLRTQIERRAAAVGVACGGYARLIQHISSALSLNSAVMRFSCQAHGTHVSKNTHVSTHTQHTHQAPVSPACQRMRKRDRTMGRRKAAQ